jgi:hypothetical protein
MLQEKIIFFVLLWEDHVWQKPFKKKTKTIKINVGGICETHP